MELLIFTLVVVIVLLAALYARLSLTLARPRDYNAMYPLFACRDDLIDLVVFNGLDRNDPWFRWTYGTVNFVLGVVHALSGRWGFADELGRRVGTEPGDRSTFQPPEGDPPEALLPVLSRIEEAANHLSRHHVAFALFVKSRNKSKSKIQRQRLREISSSIAQTRRRAAT